MSNYSNFIAELKEWANREDWSDALAASFVRMAEQVFNSELRNDWMIRHATAVLAAQRVLLPSDWLEADMIRNDKQKPLHYMDRDSFFEADDKCTEGFYTFSGRYLHVGGVFGQDGKTVYMDYYGKVPKFSDNQESFLYDQYEGVYLMSAMCFAGIHGVDDERAAGFKSNVSDFINKLNVAHMLSKHSGSTLKIRNTRTYG